MKPLSEEDAKDVQKIRDTMLRMLARREHSEAEVILKMRQRGFDMPEVERQLRDFQGRKWQDDIRYAEQFVRQRIARGQGEIRIRYELSMQNIPDALITAALEEHQIDWFELAKSVHDRRFGGAQVLSVKQKQQHLRHLQSRGFTAEQVQYACPCKFQR